MSAGYFFVITLIASYFLSLVFPLYLSWPKLITKNIDFLF